MAVGANSMAIGIPNAVCSEGNFHQCKAAQL